MSSRTGKVSRKLFLGGAMILGAAGLLRAQAPSGPIGQVESPETPKTPVTTPAPAADIPRVKNLTGVWKLNREESTKPREHRGQGNGNGGGQRSGGGWPGGMHGGYGGGMRRGESEEDREAMRALLQPAEKLTFTQSDGVIHQTDDAYRESTFYMDGRKVKKSKDPNHQEFSGKWDEYRFVSETKGPRSAKVERTYEVLEGNQQLRETIQFQTSGRNSREVYLRYVYDLVPATK